MQLSGCSAEALQSIKKKFSVVKVIDREERLFNERMDGILNKVQTFREVCRDNANKRWHGTEKVEKKKSNKDEHEQLYAELKKGEVNGAAIAKFISEVKPKIATPYIDLWNYFAEKNNVAKLEKISDSRKRKLLTRLTEKTFDLPAILTAASKQKFALEGKWFTFDWIIGNDTNYIKVLENKYTDKPVVEAGLKA